MTTTFPARRPIGRRADNPWSHTFYFVPADVYLYPSESSKMTRAKAKPVRNQRPSLAWALEYIQSHHDMWMVIPLDAPDELGQRAECKRLRSIIWKQGATRGKTSMVSQWWDGRLWVKAIA